MFKLMNYHLDLNSVHMVQGGTELSLREVIAAHTRNCMHAMPFLEMIAAKDCEQLARAAAQEIL